MTIAYKKITSADTNFIKLIADWYFAEWNIDTKTTIDRISGFPNEGVPFQLLMSVDDVPIATGGIYDHVGLLDAVPRLKALQPWLALVYTLPEYRNNGYGAKLCREIELEAKYAGVTEIFLFTHTAETLYKRLGWQQLERIALKGKDIVVMQKTL